MLLHICGPNLCSGFALLSGVHESKFNARLLSKKKKIPRNFSSLHERMRERQIKNVIK